MSKFSVNVYKLQTRQHACSAEISEAVATAVRRSPMVPAQLTFTDVLATEWCGWERTTVTDIENDASGSGSGTNRNGSTLLISSRHTEHLTTERNWARKSEYTMPDKDVEVQRFSNLCSSSRDTALCLGDALTCQTVNLQYKTKTQIIQNKTYLVNSCMATNWEWIPLKALN